MRVEKQIEQEFTRAFEEYSDAIFRHCLFKVSHRETALDLVSETFRKTWEKASTGENIRNYRAFLYRAANNLIIDYYRRKKELVFDDDQQAENSFVSEDLSGTHTEYALALQRLNELDEKYLDPVFMRHVQDFGVSEIAEILAESENTISVRINRGLAQLRKKLEKSKD